MLKHIIGALAAILLLVWLAMVAKTRSMIIGVGFPIAGFSLAVVWFIWAANDRIAARAQPQMLDLEALELIKKAVREKAQRERERAQGSNDSGAAAPALGTDSRRADFDGDSSGGDGGGD
jgi:hypothetical protein